MQDKVNAIIIVTSITVTCVDATVTMICMIAESSCEIKTAGRFVTKGNIFTTCSSPRLCLNTSYNHSELQPSESDSDQ